MKRFRPSFLFVATIALVVLSAEAAWACPGCVAPEDGSNLGYLIATLLMGITPFVLLGASIYGVRKMLQSNRDGSTQLETSQKSSASLTR